MRPLALAVAAVLLVSGCGGGDDQNSSSQIQANPTDMAFAQEMLTHHERGIDAADLARDQAKDPVVRRSARDLIQFQAVEAQTLRTVLRVLSEGGVDEGDLGVPQTSLDPSKLPSAADFDRAYAQAMIPHHELAIRMAAAERRGGEHAELRRMSEDITDLARFQIRQLKRAQGAG